MIGIKKFIVIVLDGFGVGAMDDVGRTRPADTGANTCTHLFETVPDLALPNLARLGLAGIIGRAYPGLQSCRQATFGCARLMHYGADTFFGHQEIMGTKPEAACGESIGGSIERIDRTLGDAGHRTRLYEPRRERRLVVVDEACTVADNIECDPGQALNVTAAIDDLPFSQVLEIGRIVRGMVRVPRVITFGGRGIHLADLLAAVEVHGDYIGVNAPRSGVYDDDYHCAHLGFGVDERVQVPYLLGQRGIRVHLVGKVADVCANRFGESESIVETERVLFRTLQLASDKEGGFICANVQETDLAGHQQDSRRYANRLSVADELIGRIVKAMSEEDVLVVMADHGNDPTIGHPHHTRERVPLMIHHDRAYRGFIGERVTLSDVGATVTDFFDVPAPQNGTSFLQLI